MLLGVFKRLCSPSSFLSSVARPTIVMPRYSRRTLQQFALIISVLSIFYNGAEGAVSIALGAESDSRSLVFFGIQSGIEVASATIVVWRFRKIAKPGEEGEIRMSAHELRFVDFRLVVD